MKANYETIRKGLELFLPSVGKRVMELRRNAESDPSFAKLKKDKTIVTLGDTTSEDLIRKWIIKRFPDDTIRGEERKERPGGTRRWIIDPIDGTYNFNYFGEMFAISVGLAKDNDPKIGLLYFPAEKIMVSASEGDRVWLNGEPLAVLGGKTKIEEALIVAQSRQLHAEYFAHPRFAKAIQKEVHLSLFALDADGPAGSFTFAFLQQILQGKADAILHPGVTPYDVGAICAIAKSLNFPFSGYEGEPIDFSKDTISFVLSKNAELHEQIIEALDSGR